MEDFFVCISIFLIHCCFEEEQKIVMIKHLFNNNHWNEQKKNAEWKKN